MQQAFASVGDDNGDVRGEVDRWYTDDGQDREDVYLRARDRATLQAFLAKHAASKPLPPDRRFAIETFEETDPAARTYFVVSSPVLDGRMIQTAKGEYDDVTHRPIVEVTLTGAGARVLAAATTQNRGGKLAIVVQDKVMSAPVVMNTIEGGRFTLSLGSGDLAQMEREREDLVRRLQRCSSAK